MHRWRRVGKGMVATGLSLTVLGAHCEICEQPQVAVAPADVIAGSVTWTKGTTSGTQAVDDASSALVCSVSATIGSSSADGDGALNAIYDDPRFDETTTWVLLRCSAGDEDDRNLSLHLELSDARDWAAGDVVDLRPTATLWSYEDCESDCIICEAPVDGLDLRVTVTEATGGRAEAPAAVTDDFARAVQLDVDTQTPALGEPSTGAGSCDVAVAMAGSISFRWDASHFSRVEGCD